MAKEVSMNSIVYIGMDVHKNSFSLCALDKETGAIILEEKGASTVKFITQFVDKIKKMKGNDIEIRTGYEAGCLGYSLYKGLTAKNINCDILAPTTMYSSVKKSLNKNDRLDAQHIATNLCNGTYKAVYVIDEKDEEVKEYIRMIGDFKKQLTATKQQIQAFLLRNGKKFEDGKNPWTIAYMKWLKKVDLKGLKKETLDEYVLQYEMMTDKIERFEAKLAELSQQERYLEPVAHLRCFKGIDTRAAMTMHVEVSDFSRFPNPKLFAGFLGLTPGDDSSGEKNKKLGITKQGNVTLRKMFIESAQAAVRGNPGIKSKKLKARQKGQDSKVIAYADKCAKRLKHKYTRMIESGKSKNVAITAVARELACFVWGMETGNID